MCASRFSSEDFDVLQQLIDPNAIPDFVAAKAKLAVHKSAKRKAQLAPASCEQAASDASQPPKRRKAATHSLDIASESHSANVSSQHESGSEDTAGPDPTLACEPSPNQVDASSPHASSAASDQPAYSDDTYTIAQCVVQRQLAAFTSEGFSHYQQTCLLRLGLASKGPADTVGDGECMFRAYSQQPSSQ